MLDGKLGARILLFPDSIMGLMGMGWVLQGVGFPGTLEVAVCVCVYHFQCGCTMRYATHAVMMSHSLTGWEHVMHVTHVAYGAHNAASVTHPPPSRVCQGWLWV